MPGTGAVYIFTPDASSAGSWTQQAYVKKVKIGGTHEFGYSVSLSADGNTLAVGAWKEPSNSSGVNAPPVFGTAGVGSGAAFILTRAGSTWTEEAYIKASNALGSEYFGRSVSISDDGNRLAVSAYNESGGSTGINGTQTRVDDGGGSYVDDSSGAVYMFNRNGTLWSQASYIKASNTGQGDEFGGSVSLSGDGNTLAVGAAREDSNATTIGGDQTNNAITSTGAVYLY
jgi:hypothetical protein